MSSNYVSDRKLSFKNEKPEPQINMTHFLIMFSGSKCVYLLQNYLYIFTGIIGIFPQMLVCYHFFEIVIIALFGPSLVCQ